MPSQKPQELLLQQPWQVLHEQLEHVPHLVPQEPQQLALVALLELRVPQELLQQSWTPELLQQLRQLLQEQLGLKPHPELVQLRMLQLQEQLGLKLHPELGP